MSANLLEYPILYVDDERENIVAFQYALDDRFRVITASSGAQALEIIAREPVAILLCDQRMPEMTGVELCMHALALRPDMQRMLITAYSDMEVAIAAINIGHVSRFLLKPWRGEELGQVLEAAIELEHLARTVRELEARLVADAPQRASLVANAELVHELANPLAALTMTVSLARDTADRVLSAASPASVAAPLGAELELLRELHTDLGAGVAQLNAMVRRLQQGALTESVAGQCELGMVMESAVRIVRRAVGQHATLEVVCSTPIMLPIDPSVMAEIAINLLMNASQAIHAKGLLDRTIRIEGRPNGEHVIMAVEDDGPGIPREDVPRLFNVPYSTRGHGRGLGLSIVRELVRRVGGAITVQSEPGHGARFEVSVPVRGRPAFLGVPAGR